MRPGGLSPIKFPAFMPHDTVHMATYSTMNIIMGPATGDDDLMILMMRLLNFFYKSSNAGLQAVVEMHCPLAS